MTNDLALPDNTQDIFSMGKSVIESSETSLRLTETKGNFLVGKYLGMKTVTRKRDGETFTFARFAILKTNCDAAVGIGEIVTVLAGGLLGWALQKQAEGRMLAVRYDGDAPGKLKKGGTAEMHKYTVRDITEELAAQGLQ